MAVVKGIQEGDKSPTLYSWYDKLYDYDKFKQDADSGVREYIASLKRGDTDADQFMLAYSDIMAGIKDGSITFKDGKYIDSRGRYSNGLYYDNKHGRQSSKKPSRDYYGLMANYIYGKQRSLSEYSAPEDKTKLKWDGNQSIGLAITRYIFNSDIWNNLDFLDLNEWDESGKVKGVDNRHRKLYDAFNHVLGNFDNLFSGYSLEDKVNATKYILEAMNYLNDGKIDPGDYLALNKAAGGLNYRQMFSDRTVASPTPELSTTQGTEPGGNSDFISWVSKKYPVFGGTLNSARSLKDGKTYTSDVLNIITNSINLLNESDLYRIIRSFISDKNYKFNNEDAVFSAFGDEDHSFTNSFGARLALLALKERNLIKSFGTQQPDLYYIPNTDNNLRFTSWVWDANNGTLSEMRYHDIPQLRERILQEWYKENPAGNNQYLINAYKPYFKKEGGILIAYTGVKFGENANWYTGVFESLLNHILEGLDKDSGYYSWLNDMQDKHRELYTAAGPDFLKKAYKSDNVGAYLNLYKSGYLEEWNGNPVGYNSLGITNALKLGMFDKSGGIRLSGDWAEKWVTDNLYSGITDYRRLLGRKGDFTDEQLAQTISAFKEKGYDFIEDENGYYKLKPIESLSDTPEGTTNTSPETLDVGKKENSLEKPSGDEKEVNVSLINPIEQKSKTKLSNSFGNSIQQLVPELMSIGRLFSSIRTNNKISETVRKSLTPVSKTTWLSQSPVTGNESVKQFYMREAANKEKLATRIGTADPTLYFSGLLEANKQANDLRIQGLLADDAEIKRTKAEALKRLEDNAARRSEVANFNRASINLTNRELAQLEAARLRKNEESWANKLAESGERLRLKVELDKERRTAFGLLVAERNIEKLYLDVLQKAQEAALKWQRDPANTSKTLSEMPNYFNFLKLLLMWKEDNLLAAHANAYGYRYSSDLLNRSAMDIGSKYGFLKNGGQLRPSTLYMINKVLRNENDT